MKETRLEKILLERTFMEVYCHFHPISALRRGLSRQGAVPASMLSSLPSGSRVVVTGLVIFFHTPPTRSGKRIIFATLEDETGLLDTVIMPNVQERWGKVIYTSEILTLEGRLLKEGKNGKSLSIKAIRVIPGLSGSIQEVSYALRQPITENP